MNPSRRAGKLEYTNCIGLRGEVIPLDRKPRLVKECGGKIARVYSRIKWPALRLLCQTQICRELYHEITRRFLNVVIEQIRCTVNRRVHIGEFVYTLRADGSVKAEWREATKKEGSTSPCSTGLSPHVVWLRGTHHNSNFLLPQIPLEIHNSARGQKAFSISERYLPSPLPLSKAAIGRLQECSLIRDAQLNTNRRSPRFCSPNLGPFRMIIFC